MKLLFCICYGPVTMHHVRVKKKLLCYDKLHAYLGMYPTCILTFHTFKCDEEDYAIISNVTKSHGC